MIFKRYQEASFSWKYSSANNKWFRMEKVRVVLHKKASFSAHYKSS